MSFVARHHRGLLGWWAPYFKTVINEEGIVVTRFLRSSLLLKWSEIQCLDLAGLRDADISFVTDANLKRLLEKANRTRSFLIIIPDARNFADGTIKNWFAGANVLGLTNIRREDARALFEELKRRAAQHTIKLDTIVIDGSV